MDNIEELSSNITWEYIEYLAKRGIPTYTNDGAVNPEFIKYMSMKQEEEK